MVGRRVKIRSSDRFYFLMLQNHCGWLDFTHEIKRRLFLGRKVMTNLDSILKSRDITLLTKIHYSQSYCFSGSHVRMWELDYKEGWALKNWSFWNVMLEKTLESPLSCKEINPVNPKGNQPWIFIGRTDAEVEAPIHGPTDAKSWFSGKDPILGNITGKRRKGWQRMSWLDSIINSMDMNLSKLQERVEDRGAWHGIVHRIAKCLTQLSNWTRATHLLLCREV